jgi:tripartite-type tricarboxylate transporter receptor subunit TctC
MRVLTTPEATAQLAALGVTLTPNTPAEAAAFFRAETVKWNRVIEAANLTLD